MINSTLPERLKSIHILLASQSPRRQSLIKELGFSYTVIKADVEEVFDKELKREQIPLYLCELKADAFKNKLADNEIVVTADTVVWVENMVLNKPKDPEDAFNMLKNLSGKKHEVITGVCLKNNSRKKIFHVVTDVYFKHLTDEEIQYYIDNYKPFDKAGAYGAQEWLGFIAVEKIVGSYFNVMGLPVKELYEEILRF
jgi:septum formation protein